MTHAVCMPSSLTCSLGVAFVVLSGGWHSTVFVDKRVTQQNIRKTARSVAWGQEEALQ